MNDLFRDIRETFNEIFAKDFMTTRLRLLAMTSGFCFVIGSCTAWSLKDRQEKLLTLKAMPIATMDAPVSASAKKKTVVASKCSFVSKLPLVTFKVETDARKGNLKKSILLKGATSADEPVLFVRDVKNPTNYHCVESFDEKDKRFTKITRRLNLKEGSYEVYLGSHTKGVWTDQFIEIHSM